MPRQPLAFSRRGFLKLAAAGVVARITPSCGDNADATDLVFPQGIASGDPSPSTIVLWARVGTFANQEDVIWEVALDEAFTQLISRGGATAMAEDDFTLRIKLTDLSPATTYYYRFIARGTSSRIGRTRTAPDPESDVPVRFAWASCQDFVDRYYHAWGLLEDEPDLDFVLFVGDYIYEYETGTDIEFKKTDGPRTIDLPDGITVGDFTPVIAAATLADYRTLYRRYKSDPQLRRAHERYPFIIMWDDHEFANDCWQDHATDYNDLDGDEQSPERRRNATRAFYEYLPLDVPYDLDAGFPNDIRLYRAVKWGKHVEAFLTDQRYYRSDHVIPEGGLDREVGHVLMNSPIGSRVFAIKDVFDQREAAAAPTMLGATQRDWLVSALEGSTATWKLWVSPTVVSQMALDLRAYPELPDLLRNLYYFKLDHWDGFRSERAAILSHAAQLDNVVVLSGDIHAFYASPVYENFDAPEAVPAAVEFTVTGISSSPVQEQTVKLVSSSRLLSGLGLDSIVAQFDTVLRAANPHFVHASSNGYGIAIAEVDRDRELRVTFLELDDVSTLEPPPVRRTVYRVPAGERRIEPVS